MSLSCSKISCIAHPIRDHNSRSGFLHRKDGCRKPPLDESTIAVSITRSSLYLQLLVSVTICGGVGCYTLYYFYEKRRNQKPQLRFRRILCDNSDSPFKHLILESDTESPSSKSLCHPYRDQILQLNDSCFPYIRKEPAWPDLRVPWVWVDTKRGLDDLIRELKVSAFLLSFLN